MASSEKINTQPTKKTFNCIYHLYTPIYTQFRQLSPFIQRYISITFLFTFQQSFNMKKALLFSALIAVCCAFAAVSYTKITPKTEDVIITPPPPLDDFEEESEWDGYDVEKEMSFKGDATFTKLLELFPKGTLPFTITTNVLRDYADSMAHAKFQKVEKKVIPRAFRKYFPGLDEEEYFSRMPPPLPEPLLAFEANGKHVLIYFSSRYGKDYNVATYNAKGKLITNRRFAEVDLKNITEASLDENLNLTRARYDIIWDKPMDKNGYKNNKITELKLTKKTVESLIKKGSEKEIKIEKDALVRATP
jgi:hypothetical protein